VVAVVIVVVVVVVVVAAAAVAAVLVAAGVEAEDVADEAESNVKTNMIQNTTYKQANELSALTHQRAIGSRKWSKL